MKTYENLGLGGEGKDSGGTIIEDAVNRFLTDFKSDVHLIDLTVHGSKTTARADHS
jgi:hypothetical protein